MSMRATFTTEFIYDGSDGWQERKEKLCAILGTVWEPKNGTVIGAIHGITKGLDLSEEDVRRYIEEMSQELMWVSVRDFKIVWLLEGGDIIIRQIFGKTK